MICTAMPLFYTKLYSTSYIELLKKFVLAEHGGTYF